MEKSFEKANLFKQKETVRQKCERKCKVDCIEYIASDLRITNNLLHYLQYGPNERIACSKQVYQTFEHQSSNIEG